MKISLNWLKEFIEIPDSPDELGEILTNLGLEVEGKEKVQSIAGGLKGIVVGHVEECIKHPNADRLSLTKVSTGSGQVLSIVCGAPNVAKGQKVAVATIGTTLYPYEGDPFKIKRGKIRGELSEGMICAEDEMGMSNDHSGILILPDEVEPGKPLTQYFPIETDYVYDIGLTPNRSDATSHLGVARDLAAYYSFKFKRNWKVTYPEIEDLSFEGTENPVKVSVEDTEGCPRYSGISLSGVEIRESPAWIQQRLKAIDVRPLNNIVDITNFVLHEYGQPLHAFDQKKIGNATIIVKNLDEGSNFQSLDGIDRKLHNSDLMICDGKNKGMCIAGVYGGLNSGVTEETTDIFLESAHFNATRIRKTSTAHLLRTEAAKCFEKGTDPNRTVAALKRAASLMVQYGDATISSSLVDVYPQKVLPNQVVVRLSRIQLLIGQNLNQKEISEILTALSMEHTFADGAFDVLVPTDKADVTREADVIEEILRIYGFNNVRTDDRINTSVTIAKGMDLYGLRRLLTNFLSGHGFNEMMGLSLVPSQLYDSEENGESDHLVRINNTSNIHLDVMRPDMMMSMLQSVAYNHNRQQNNLRLFEFGATYRKDGDDYVEKQVLSLVLTGAEEEDTWLGPTRDVDFYTVKRSVHEVLTRLGIDRYQCSELNDSCFGAGMRYHLGKINLVQMGTVADVVKQKAGVKGDILYAEFMLSEMLVRFEKNDVVVKDIPRYPSIRRDLALVLDEKLEYQRLEEVVRKSGGRILSELNLFDVYVDDDLKRQKKKSYAISMNFIDPEKSLRDKEVDKVIQKILDQCNRQLGAVIR